MPADELMQEIKVPPTKGGFCDGLDPALDEDGFPASFLADSENIRVGKGLWETRLGMALWKAMAGSGDVRLLDSISLANGNRVRLLARGTGTNAALYDYEEGTDTTFQATSGGTGLGGTTEAYFQGVVLNDFYYFTDRTGALRRYTPSSGVASVSQPTKPASAPRYRARPYAYLDSWNGNGGVATFGWTQTDAANFPITDGSTAKPNPQGGRTVKLAMTAPGSSGDSIYENVANETLNSDTIAFWYQQERNKFHIVFEIGLNAAGDLISENLRAKTASEWYPKFVPVGGIGTISFKRFRVVEEVTYNEYVGRLILPGRLNGQYRWRYTYYSTTTGAESAPSDISNSGQPVDFSMIGKSDDTSTAAAMNKSCALSFAAGAGTTNKIRIYRNGGVRNLTVDDFGREVWYRVGEIYDQSTTITSSPIVSATSFTVASTTNLAAGDTLVIGKGTASEEYVTIATGGIAGSTITVTEPLSVAHTSGDALQIAFLDNVPDTQIDLGTKLSVERDDAPTAAKWIARSPDGRLWLFNYKVDGVDQPTGFAISNMPTIDRPTDYEVFPKNVDPITRRDLLQGFRGQIGGDSTDEAITWGGQFGGAMYAFTRRRLYRFNGYSQADWGPNAVEKILDVGCLNGDTVAECNGVLYWVADGPRVMRWDGQSAPQSVSHERINVKLAASPSAYWSQWFARYHAQQDGSYYKLYMTPSGATTNTDRLGLPYREWRVGAGLLLHRLERQDRLAERGGPGGRQRCPRTVPGRHRRERVSGGERDHRQLGAREDTVRHQEVPAFRLHRPLAHLPLPDGFRHRQRDPDRADGRLQLRRHYQDLHALLLRHRGQGNLPAALAHPVRTVGAGANLRRRE
jgi:hypothetical protein